MEADSSIGYTAGAPVVVYLEVCVHEVPQVMSPVMQATGLQNVHIWVLLHLMFSFTYSGEPLRQSCVVLLVLRLAACFHGDFRVLATWRGDSALSSETSKNARQWHFIRAEGSSNGSDVRGAGSTSDKKSTPISYEILDFAEFHDSARAHLPVLSRRLFGVCKRHLVYFFSFWYWVLVLWYAYDGERGIGIVTTFAAEYFAFFFFFAFYVLGPCVTGADPASHGVRLWRGGSASTPAFSLLFPFIVLVVDDRQGARRIFYGSSFFFYLFFYSFVEYVDIDALSYFKAPGPYCGAEGRWRIVGLTVSASV